MHPTPRHPQSAVVLPHQLTSVDSDIAAFVKQLNWDIAPFMRTDFSCQGDPGQKTCSAYLTLSCDNKFYQMNLAEHIRAETRASTGYRPRVLHLGEYGTYDLPRAGKNIMCETDNIDGSKYGGWVSHVWPRNFWRITVRWRPEEFEIVKMLLLDFSSSLKAVRDLSLLGMSA